MFLTDNLRMHYIEWDYVVDGSNLLGWVLY